jgi:hypothetical protein
MGKGQTFKTMSYRVVWVEKIVKLLAVVNTPSRNIGYLTATRATPRRTPFTRPVFKGRFNVLRVDAPDRFRVLEEMKNSQWAAHGEKFINFKGENVAIGNFHEFSRHALLALVVIGQLANQRVR